MEFDDPFLLHCSQTGSGIEQQRSLFDDPFLLHCSQTPSGRLLCFLSFDDPFLLHCSQTEPAWVMQTLLFDDPFLLHCSQTEIMLDVTITGLMILFFYTALKLRASTEWTVAVWWSFSFTLLSNTALCVGLLDLVWWSFSFTLLSNAELLWRPNADVWWSFSFTLLSNSGRRQRERLSFDDPFLLHCSQTLRNTTKSTTSLMILFFYTALKQSYTVEPLEAGLMILFFYTALKRLLPAYQQHLRLMILFFYTALKPEWSGFVLWWVWWSFSFTLLSNTTAQVESKHLFDDPFLLHCSQTNTSPSLSSVRLMILFFYTALKLNEPLLAEMAGLMILFFYTALKRNASGLRGLYCLMILFFYTALKPF